MKVVQGPRDVQKPPKSIRPAIAGKVWQQGQHNTQRPRSGESTSPQSHCLVCPRTGYVADDGGLARAALQVDPPMGAVHLLEDDISDTAPSHILHGLCRGKAAPLIREGETSRKRQGCQAGIGRARYRAPAHQVHLWEVHPIQLDIAGIAELNDPRMAQLQKGNQAASIHHSRTRVLAC